MLKIEVLKRWLNYRKRTKPLSTIVMHATAGSTLKGALETLRARGFSYHYLIEKDGIVHKCVPSEKVAFHAGQSIGPDGRWVNGYSIGISLVNRNDGKDPYPEVQKNAVQELILDLKRVFPKILHLTTHRQISWPRKNDPVGLSGFLREVAVCAGLKYWSRMGVPE